MNTELHTLFAKAPDVVAVCRASDGSLWVLVPRQHDRRAITDVLVMPAVTAQSLDEDGEPISLPVDCARTWWTHLMSLPIDRWEKPTFFFPPGPELRMRRESVVLVCRARVTLTLFTQ